MECLNLELGNVEIFLYYFVKEESAMIPINSHPKMYSSMEGE